MVGLALGDAERKRNGALVRRDKDVERVLAETERDRDRDNEGEGEGEDEGEGKLGHEGERSTTMIFLMGASNWTSIPPFFSYLMYK